LISSAATIHLGGPTIQDVIEIVFRESFQKLLLSLNKLFRFLVEDINELVSLVISNNVFEANLH